MLINQRNASCVKGKLFTCLLVLQGIGDSAQGFVNAVLFLPFNTEVREWFKEKCSLCKQGKENAVNGEGCEL